MPHYTFIDKNTDKEFNKEMKISELEVYLSENPHIQQIFNTPPTLGNPIKLGIKKTDGSFRNRIKEMENTYGKQHTNLDGGGNLSEI